MESVSPGRYDFCPHCKSGKPLHFRSDTSEWVHTYVNGSGVSHTICQASELRSKDIGS